MEKESKIWTEKQKQKKAYIATPHQKKTTILEKKVFRNEVDEERRKEIENRYRKRKY